MKLVGSFLSKVAAAGVALSIMSLAITAHAQTQQGQAKVVAIKGSAQYSQGGAWMPLKVGDVLKAGALVQTGAASQVDLFLANNGPSVRVTEDSTLGLTALTFDNTGADVVIDTELNLTVGRILGTVKKTSDASRYEVKIPTGTVSIRGTQYDISANGLIRIIKGMAIMNFKAPSGVVSTHQVNAGQTFNPDTQTVVPTPSDYQPGMGPMAGTEEGVPAWGQTVSGLNLPITSPGHTVSAEQEGDGIVAPNILNPLPGYDGGYQPPVSPTWPR
jgi:opacity protein-like surface antigen